MKRFLLSVAVVLSIAQMTVASGFDNVAKPEGQQPEEVVVGTEDAGQTVKYEANHKLIISGNLNFRRCVSVGTPQEKCDNSGGDGSITIVGEFGGENNNLAQLIALLLKLQQSVGKPSEQVVEKPSEKPAV